MEAVGREKRRRIVQTPRDGEEIDVVRAGRRSCRARRAIVGLREQLDRGSVIGKERADRDVRHADDDDLRVRGRAPDRSEQRIVRPRERRGIDPARHIVAADAHDDAIGVTLAQPADLQPEDVGGGAAADRVVRDLAAGMPRFHRTVEIESEAARCIARARAQREAVAEDGDGDRRSGFRYTSRVPVSPACARSGGKAQSEKRDPTQRCARPQAG
jgi:hypothetical protein